MKKNLRFFTYLAVLGCMTTTSLVACSGGDDDGPTGEVAEYMNELKKTSEDNHLYYHYFRYSNNAKAYEPWDVWAWAYKPTAGEGAKFDWVGRTQSADYLTATGDATIGKFGGAYVDIDLGKDYKGGWNDIKKTIGAKDVSYKGAEQIGLQIVQSSTRIQKDTEFWNNDGSNLYIKLKDYALELEGGGTAYHCFVVQDDVQNPQKYPVSDVNDPFANDDGKNVTYGDSQYDNVEWNKYASMKKTAADFKEAGVGYQIMVSSFADSDGDGFGDIYGITQKLDYLNTLGVKVLWLTPIQLSDSYHGYDITDYEKVDPKFGSKNSTAGKANQGVVTEDTALSDYKELITEAHNRNMKVVMDLVLNHTSTSNKWFVKSANLDKDYRGYYQWGNHETNKSKINQKNNWYPYGDHCYSYYAKFGSSMPELNFSYKTTREAVEDMSVYWVKDVGVDGFRLDAVKHIYMENEVSSTKGDTIIYDKSESGDYSSDLTKNLHFFRELKAAVTDKAGRDVFFVGENFDGHAYQVAPYYESFDSLFDFYSYFNLTSGAATGRGNNTTGFGTVGGFMVNESAFNVSSESNIKDGHGDFNKANGSAWNFVSVYDTYNKYRGDTSLPGLFTSNHDIARVINRVAGTGTTKGLQAQGNISKTNWSTYETSANLVKFSELMMPGLTWVYYGDEIGMTGNFEGSTKKASDSYSDLWYRQPMKWSSATDANKKGDKYGTTSYYVTGSNMLVKQDSVNNSATVMGALNADGQFNTGNAELVKMKEFINLKARQDNVGKALRYGSIKHVYFANGDNCANVLQFERTYGTTTVQVMINFNSGTNFTSFSNGWNSSASGDKVLASYNGATPGNLPKYSAIVVLK